MTAGIQLLKNKTKPEIDFLGLAPTVVNTALEGGERSQVPRA